MEVKINGNTYNWESNFLNEVNQIKQSKWSKKREDYFCFETIGNTKCFIKRSEVGFDGKSIFDKIIDKDIQAIPKVYSVSEVLENYKKVQYLVTEFIEGDTLDVVLNNGVQVNLTSFAEDLTNGIKSLNDLGYWHSDLNADNVFISTSGNTYIIDIDSCVENTNRPTYTTNKSGALTTLSNQLGSYALKYYKKYLNKSTDFSFSNIDGTNLNYFQIIFLIFQVKYFLQQKRVNPNLIWKKSTFKGLDVEDEIHNFNPAYANRVFEDGLKKTLDKEVVIKFLKNLIDDSIKNVPDTNALKKIQELRTLKVKYSKLEIKASRLEKKANELQTNNKKLVEQIDRLNTKKTKVSGISWFWGIVACLAIFIGLVTYNNINEKLSDYKSRFDSEREKLSDATNKLNELNNSFDELSNVIDPFIISNIEFKNLKDGVIGNTFNKSSTDYISPQLEIYSLKDEKVEIRYTRHDKDHDYWNFTDPDKSYLKKYFSKYYHFEDFNLTKGKNTIKFHWSIGGGNWGYSPYTYKFYINGKYIKSKSLNIR
ncbi:protein kinase [Polaribacter vadi]|uniref:protein kinase n=1 Tax=Polaribacter TaxID=52959 RepID=UPI001C08A0B2|nr:MULTISPECIES: protein kinase [Polaribacter]MBU3012678.1 protein kinase [Polaribacter vadi]MDO6742495.1 protein kinase [Polaribacter sp. 1_MG-2023]